LFLLFSIIVQCWHLELSGIPKSIIASDSDYFASDSVLTNLAWRLLFQYFIHFNTKDP
jgi:hypothetical protein